MHSPICNHFFHWAESIRSSLHGGPRGMHSPICNHFFHWAESIRSSLHGGPRGMHSPICNHFFHWAEFIRSSLHRCTFDFIGCATGLLLSLGGIHKPADEYETCQDASIA